LNLEGVSKVSVVVHRARGEEALAALKKALTVS
jgi:hypothetical protein